MGHTGEVVGGADDYVDALSPDPAKWPTGLATTGQSGMREMAPTLAEVQRPRTPEPVTVDEGTASMAGLARVSYANRQAPTINELRHKYPWTTRGSRAVTAGLNFGRHY